ncbi:transcriptional regulatory protein [Apiospora rasikravindrae]|uniref:Transcriptional regulatory protein n=1 Tax=Apiospora rasikravindrae TaxID=990691 RepID=A0ABR1UDK2_9PEZI
MPEEGSVHALLPACQRCKLRKIKCDRQAPKCSGCTKSKAACIIVDPVTSERYPRDFIHQLEVRAQELQAKATATAAVTTVTTPISEGSGTAGGTGDSNTEEPGPVAAAERTPSNQALDSPAASRGFVGDGSGLSFLRSIFQDSRWRVYEPQIMQLLAERLQIPELTISPNPQPTLEEATALLDNYFARFHIHHTFLLRQDVLGIFNRIYNGTPPQPPSAQDFFRLFMVFSISAVTRYRRASIPICTYTFAPAAPKGDSSEHPYGYYLAAQEYVGSIPLVGSVEAIQNLLLVCRFGMYHHIGTSLWEISQFCMRQCVEQNLHARPRPGIDLLKEQHQRRIFWECYISDRYSSGVLGRPFAISENDISVELPIDAADETIADAMLSGTTLSGVPLNIDGRPTELSVFVGRGLSPIDGDTIPSSQVSSGHVYVLLYQFLGELEAWRRDAPTFPEPRSLYERTEWYEFLLEKDKLLLVRGAIHTAPRRHHDQPPDDLLVMCLGCATRIIELYDSMARSRYITWTRGYFQVIFAAGLSIIYCVSLGLHHRADDAAATKTRRTLHLCNDILVSFKKEMPDAGRFAVVFSILKDHFLRDPGSSLVGPASGAAGGPSHVGNNHTSNLQPIPVGGDEPITNIPSVAVPAESGMETAVSGWQQQQGGDGCSFMMRTDPNAFDPVQADNMAYGEGIGFGADHDLLGAWPILTDEMMEHLEAGLGEFAWGTQGMDGFAWDNLY